MKKSKLVSFAKNNLSKKSLGMLKGGNVPPKCCDCTCTFAENSGCINGTGTTKEN